MLNLAKFPITTASYWEEDFKAIPSVTIVTNGANASFASISSVTANKNYCGVYAYSSGTNNTNSVRVFTSNLAMELGGGIVSCRNKIEIPTLFTVAQDGIFRIGIGNIITATNADQDHVDGIYFEYNRSLSLNWRICTSSASVRTKIITSSVITASIYNLHFIINEAGTSVDFFVNGTNVGTINTNIPLLTTMGFNGYLKKTVGNTTFKIKQDYAIVQKLITKGR